MSRATADDQLKFLLSCVKHSNGGRVDFTEVAAECGIVSKGAAAKRYERLMKANGINLSGGPSSPRSKHGTPSRSKSKAAIAKAAADKRRKIEGDFSCLAEEDEDDDDESDHKSTIPKFEPFEYNMEPPGSGSMMYKQEVDGMAAFSPYGHPQTMMVPAAPVSQNYPSRIAMSMMSPMSSAYHPSPVNGLAQHPFDQNLDRSNTYFTGPVMVARVNPSPNNRISQVSDEFCNPAAFPQAAGDSAVYESMLDSESYDGVHSHEYQPRSGSTTPYKVFMTPQEVVSSADGELRGYRRDNDHISGHGSRGHEAIFISD